MCLPCVETEPTAEGGEKEVVTEEDSILLKRKKKKKGEQGKDREFASVSSVYVQLIRARLFKTNDVVS